MRQRRDLDGWGSWRPRNYSRGTINQRILERRSAARPAARLRSRAARRSPPATAVVSRTPTIRPSRRRRCRPRPARCRRPSLPFGAAGHALAQIELQALLLVLDDLDVLAAVAHLHRVLAGGDALELDRGLPDVGAVDDDARALGFRLDPKPALAQLAPGLRQVDAHADVVGLELACFIEQ